MTLILRKLLASSTYAISHTLSGLAFKLETAAKQSAAVDAPPEQLADDWEELDELADEWEPDEDDESTDEKPHYTPDQLAAMRGEMVKLREFFQLAKSITKNSKGEVLLTALRRGFAAAADAQQGWGNASAEGHDLHGIATHPRIPVPPPATDRVRGQRHAVQRHEQRSSFQGNLPPLA
jgi:hypothetical protein